MNAAIHETKTLNHLAHTSWWLRRGKIVTHSPRSTRFGCARPTCTLDWSECAREAVRNTPAPPDTKQVIWPGTQK